MIQAYIISDNSVTVHVDGQPKTVCSSHPNYSKIIEAVKNGNEKEFLKYANTGETIKNNFTKVGISKVEIKDGNVCYNDKILDNEITRRILELIDYNYSFKSMVTFLENLMQNPSMSSINQTYRFLQHRNLPITEDGCFLAYKGVNNNYTDCHTGTFDNSVGQKHRIERNEVDDNRDAACSYGFHVGSLEYALGFGPKTVIVKVNPKDVVSVPKDSSEQKLRCCAYEVVSEYERPLESPVYKDNDVEPSEDYDNDEDSVVEVDDDYEYYYEDNKLKVSDGIELPEYHLYTGMILNFDYKKNDGPTTRRYNVTIREVQKDRIIALEGDTYKTFKFERMKNIVEQ